MAHRFVIRRLGSLPWPPGLGKNAGPSHPYKQLERRLRAHLGSDRHYSAAAHKHAYLTGDPEYRRIVLHALCQMPWAAGLLDDVGRRPLSHGQRRCSIDRSPSIRNGTIGPVLIASLWAYRAPGWQARFGSAIR
ncbi:hypothetical protein MGALJ_61790 (plasmid) [Mycobacterium gallinarum]|uniref:Uncharacterized protein n=1 Tax=Mycobacterium gallinarum TaxID=39689 RepID=A0A9W4B9V3_9MYCO|nr:hypothetical protein [Mycobacterium gallinarum]BBY96510.1 hypothetical protein MGALJ_61790 [Mycobacterium gallinarum]